MAAGCGNDAESPTLASPAAPVVLVETVAMGPAPDVVELPGRIEAMRTAEVRARVDGIVERLLYQEGSDVRAGAPLFQIDDREYRAQVQQAEAVVQRSEATRANSAAVVARFQPLVSRQAVSAQEFDAAVAALRQAEATVSDARAQLTLARLRLERSTVTAPIAGRVGRAQVTEGALVSAAAATLLAQINQLSPIHAVFTQSNTAILEFARDVREGRVGAADLRNIEVRLVLANGQEYGEPGHLNFADLAVDPSTGTQTLRARFANPDRTLLPGQFVRGRLRIASMGPGIRVSERAVQIAGNTASVALVSPEGTVVRRNVELGAQLRGQWMVLDGLQVGELVIVEGWHRVQPGQRVTARQVSATETGAASSVAPGPPAR